MKTKQEIISSYPEIFRELPWFECADGWNDLIDKLCQVIMQECHEQGWTPPAVTHIKEKFGELRFYVSPTTDEIYDIIDRATVLSRHICEVCGQPGETRLINRHWLRTTCDLHSGDNDD